MGAVRSFFSKGESAPVLPAVNPAVPERRKAVISGLGDPPNLSRNDLTAQSVQSAIATAERGDTRMLFQLFRDAIAGYSHIQTELSKRKHAVLSKICTIAPASKDDAGDKTACDAIKAMIEDCDDWDRSLAFLMDSCLYPVMAVEKLFRTPVPGDEAYKLGLRYTLNRLEKVDPFLYCFKLPYMPTLSNPGNPEAQWDPNDWEPDINFYSNLPMGMINYNPSASYRPEPDRHIIYRGNFLTSQRDNWGGPMRSVLLWWFLAVKGRDWWGRFMERFGVPFPVIKADMNDVTVAAMAKNALQSLTKMFGLAVNSDAEVQIVQAATANTAEAWDRFVTFCNMEISKVIVGQTLSSKPQGTGLGSGVANLQADVLEAIRAYDELTLNTSLRKQLFKQCLAINGLTGSAPKILWGGMSEGDQQIMSVTLMNLTKAGMEVTDEGIDQVSHKMGLPFQRLTIPVAAGEGKGDKHGDKTKARN